MKPIKEHIKLLRDRRGWSQQHLADASGLSLRTIQRIEISGHCSKESIMAVAAAFDIEITQIGRPENFLPSVSNTVLKIVEMMKKYIQWFGGAYILFLAIVIFILYSKYAALYHSGRPGNFDEFNSIYMNYRNVLALSGILLTIYLGTWASGYGYVQNALWKGGLVFVLGIVITGAAFSLLPWFLYPYDQYSPGAVYAFSSLVPGIFCFLCVSMLLYGIGKIHLLKNYS